MSDAVIIETGTGSDALRQGDVAEEVHPDARRRGIANAHLSDAQNATTFFHAVIHKVASYLYGPVKLLLAHRRLIEEVPGASGYLATDNAWDGRQVVIDADIDDAKLKSMLATEHVHASAAMGEVDHLLPRDLTGTDTDALALYAVVAT
jgi:hypothetical protein